MEVEATRATSTQRADELNEFLGDPNTPGHPFAYSDIVEAEENGRLPEGAVDAVRSWGFQAFLVPHQLGGKFTSLEDLFAVTRTLSSRNITLAVMFGSALLGANPIWLWGDPEQKKALADEILAGNLICFAVSEPNHGSDVLATETTIGEQDGRLLLTGTKWLVGNATRARFVTTFARMGTSRAFSMVLVDKEQLAEGTWHNLPFVKTAGLRGHDLSGIAYNGAEVPASAVIGRPGIAVVQCLKALQVTRTAIGALSLGTMDATARIALTYGQQRTLYGRPVYDLPVIRQQIAEGHLDILIGECLALPVTRALSIAPGRMSVWSSVVKYLLPVLAEQHIASMRTVLGARSYLREGVADGIFQKMERDHAIASIFEGTTHVNLASVAEQLPYILKQAVAVEETEQRWDLLGRLFSLVEPTPTWDPDGSRLEVANAGHDEITHAWSEIEERVDEIAEESKTVRLRELTDLVAHIRRVREAVYQPVVSERDFERGSVDAQRTAYEHCILHAASSCLLTWLTNRDVLGGAFADGEWLVACLDRLLHRLSSRPTISLDRLTRVEGIYLAASAEQRPFGLRDFAA